MEKISVGSHTDSGTRTNLQFISLSVLSYHLILTNMHFLKEYCLANFLCRLNCISFSWTSTVKFI